MNKNAATEREYEFSYDTLVDIITAQQALIEELTHTIFAKEKELEKNDSNYTYIISCSKE